MDRERGDRTEGSKMTDPKRDFRYTLGDLQVEAYQITPATQHSDQDWPDWLKRQRLPDDINSIFSMVENPSRLLLNLPTGEVELPPLAWIVQYNDGHLGIVDALDFEEYTKVVPVPDKVYDPPADGMPDESHMAEIFPQHIKEGKTIDDYRRPAQEEVSAVQLQPEPGAVTVLPSDAAELQSEMMQAIRLLQEGNDPVDRTADGRDEAIIDSHEKALDYLIHSMVKRTKWCTCPPGMCTNEDEAGCRINSPLVKS